MKTLCIAATTGDQARGWPIASLSLAPFNLGRGWTDTPIPHVTLPSGMVAFESYHALEVLAAHDYVVLQHWPDTDLLRTLQDFGVKVGFWLNLLSVQTVPLWNVVQHPLQETLKRFALRGTDGQPVVTWPGAIATDVCNLSFAGAVCGALEYTFERRALPDFFFVDELTDKWFCRAENAPAIPDWRAFVLRLLLEVGGMFAPVWGHNTFEAFSNVRRVVHEHATRGCKSKAEWLSHVQSLCQARGVDATASMLGLGWERADDIPAEWCRALDGSEETYTARLAWQTARTGSAFQIFNPLADA